MQPTIPIPIAIVRLSRKSLVDEYIDIGDLSREDMGEKIKSMTVDILVDVAGHSAHSGLS